MSDKIVDDVKMGKVELTFEIVKEAMEYWEGAGEAKPSKAKIGDYSLDKYKVRGRDETIKRFRDMVYEQRKISADSVDDLSVLPLPSLRPVVAKSYTELLNGICELLKKHENIVCREQAEIQAEEAHDSELKIAAARASADERAHAAEIELEDAFNSLAAAESQLDAAKTEAADAHKAKNVAEGCVAEAQRLAKIDKDELANVNIRLLEASEKLAVDSVHLASAEEKIADLQLMLGQVKGQLERTQGELAMSISMSGAAETRVTELLGTVEHQIKQIDSLKLQNDDIKEKFVAESAYRNAAESRAVHFLNRLNALESLIYKTSLPSSTSEQSETTPQGQEPMFPEMLHDNTNFQNSVMVTSGAKADKPTVRKKRK